MLTIFKWFFGIVIGLVLLYILIVVVKTVIGSSATTTITTTATTTKGTTIGSTTASVTSSVVNFSFAEWAKNFHPFQFAPLYVGTDAGNSQANSFSDAAPGNLTQNQLYWQGLNDAPNNHPTDWFPTGNGYDLNADNSNSQGNLPTGDSKYIKIYLNNNSRISNNQVISGYAYNQVFTNRTFPIMILDANQKVVGQVNAYPNGDLQANGYVAFRAVLNFYDHSNWQPSLNGYLMAMNQNEQEVNFKAVTVVPVFFANQIQRHYRESMPPMLYSSPHY